MYLVKFSQAPFFGDITPVDDERLRSIVTEAVERLGGIVSVGASRDELVSRYAQTTSHDTVKLVYSFSELHSLCDDPKYKKLLTLLKERLSKKYCGKYTPDECEPDEQGNCCRCGSGIDSLGNCLY